jgi:hypothetical protein
MIRARESISFAIAASARLKDKKILILVCCDNIRMDIVVSIISRFALRSLRFHWHHRCNITYLIFDLRCLDIRMSLCPIAGRIVNPFEGSKP